jgi:hypothetical protein
LGSVGFGKMSGQSGEWTSRMAETGVPYLCDGFYPIEAQNVMPAGLLFALQLARRRYGPKARCTKLDLHSEFKPHSVAFEAAIVGPIERETCRFTVLVEQR